MLFVVYIPFPPKLLKIESSTLFASPFTVMTVGSINRNKVKPKLKHDKLIRLLNKNYIITMYSCLNRQLIEEMSAQLNKILRALKTCLQCI